MIQTHPVRSNSPLSFDSPWMDEAETAFKEDYPAFDTTSLLDELRATEYARLQLYGPRTTALRGGTIAFNFLMPDGRIVDERLVDRRAARARLSLRTGCFCNPGAGEAAFGITKQLLRERFGDKQNLSPDEYLIALGLQSAGAIRVSLGLVTNVADVSRFLQFAQSFLDTFPIEHDLPPRMYC